MNEPDDDESNLPRVHDSERDKSPIDVLEETLRSLDGPMSVSNKLVPLEAYDVGDGNVRANPRACDLGYTEGADADMRELKTEFVMFDSDLGATYTIHADKDSVVEDVSNWA